MPHERFYLNADFSFKATVCLNGSEHHHLARVMRLRVGEEAELVNGRGSLATARISEIEKEITSLEILAVEKKESSPTLFAAIPLMRPAKLEWVIEKGTELGADVFLLYNADYSEKDSLSENQMERLHHLAISALKQSGRLYLPSIEIIPSLSSLFSRSVTYLYGDTDPGAPPLSARHPTPIIFITGPEKGFSPAETSLLKSKAQGVKLNPNILRAETAPLAALSILSLSK